MIFIPAQEFASYGQEIADEKMAALIFLQQSR